MSLLYEHCDEDLPALEAMKKIPNLRYAKVKPINMFGHHHRSVHLNYWSLLFDNDTSNCNTSSMIIKK